MECPHCEEERANGREFCGHCHEIFPRPAKLGRLRRILGALLPKGSDDSGLSILRSESTTYEVRDPRTGETQRYGDASELPEPVRRVLREATSGGAPAETRIETREEFRVVDGTGEEQVYRSLDEMPPEIRALFRKAGR